VRVGAGEAAVSGVGVGVEPHAARIRLEIRMTSRMGATQKNLIFVIRYLLIVLLLIWLDLEGIGRAWKTANSTP